MADQDSELMDCLWSLHTALLRRDGLDERLRGNPPGVLLLDRSLEAAESVIAARAELRRCLIRQGWTPPDDVVRHLRHDELVLGVRGSRSLAG